MLRRRTPLVFHLRGEVNGRSFLAGTLLPAALLLIIALLATPSSAGERDLRDLLAPIIRTEPLTAYSCADCEKRNILVHNISDLTSDHPTAAIAAAQAGVINQAFFASTFNCVMVLDSNQPEGPPIGENYNWDYVLRSQVEGAAPNHKVTAVLLTASEHWRVAEGRAWFSTPAEAMSAGSFAVLNLGASEGGTTPLDTTLFNFEEPQRESLRRAWNATIKILAIRTEVVAREQQTIKIEVRDCDDKVIVGAPIEVRYGSGGSVSSTEIRTDGDGIAQVDHIAGAASGEEMITFYWGYKRPSGRLAQTAAFDYITVGSEYRLEFDSHIRWHSVSDGLRGRFRVKASVPLVRRETTPGARTYSGKGKTQYFESEWETDEPDCSIVATGSGAALGVQFHDAPGLTDPMMRLTIGRTIERFGITCSGVSAGLGNHLWHGSFHFAHQSESVGVDGDAIVLEVKNWSMSEDEGDVLGTRTYFGAHVDGDVSFTEDTKLTIRKGKPSSQPPPARRRAVRQ
jgi:hypothetical protein